MDRSGLAHPAWQALFPSLVNRLINSTWPIPASMVSATSWPEHPCTGKQSRSQTALTEEEGSRVE